MNPTSSGTSHRTTTTCGSSSSSCACIIQKTTIAASPAAGEFLAGWLAKGWVEDAHGNLDAQGILDILDSLGAKGADYAIQSPRLHLSRLGHAVVASENGVA